MDGSVKLTFPDTEYVSVTFPGVVRDKKTFERMIPHVALAGQQNASELALKLHLRPEDPNQIPIKGELAPSGAVLVKIIRRVRKSTGEELSSTAQIMGSITSNWSFETLADCQMTDSRPISKRLKMGPSESTAEFHRRMLNEPNLAFPPHWLPK